MTQLQPSRCKPAEYVRSVYAITPEADTPFDALLSPHYWAHVSMSFRPGCKIEIYPPEGHYYAELLVQDCQRLWAKVAVLRKVEFDAVDVGAEDLDLSSYEVKWGGPNALWRVHRKADKAILKSDLGTKDEASAWLVQHVRTVAPKKAAA